MLPFCLLLLCECVLYAYYPHNFVAHWCNWLLAEWGAGWGAKLAAANASVAFAAAVPRQRRPSCCCIT